MKKSLLAIAVLGAFSSLASAQSSVTIYGVLDLAVTKGNGGTAFNQGANGTSKAWQLKQSTASRLGFRGTEDLGGGLSAQFQIEHRFDPDTGAQSNPNIFWQGRSYVQLTSVTAGSVYLGREYSPMFWIANKLDPFGWDGVGQMGGRQFAGYSVQGTAQASSAGTPASRSANTVGYKSPNIGGLTVQAAVGLAEGTTVDRDTAAIVEYGAGPIYFGVGYSRLKGAVKSTIAGPISVPGGASNVLLSTNGDDSSLFSIGGAYDFGVIRPMVYFAQGDFKNAVITPALAAGLPRTQTARNRFYEIAATAPVGGGLVKMAYGRLEPRGANNTENKIGLGYNYPLSKRTNLYADIGLAKADGKTNNNAYAFGIRHNF